MLLKDANIAIENALEEEKQAQEAKYGRRNKMRYIDRLLNELEMLNLAEERNVPGGLRTAVAELISETPEVQSKPTESVCDIMDVLFEIQDTLMFNQIEDE